MKNDMSMLDEEEESGGAAEWLTTYSDMVTLLLTFFVLLFAISNVDAQKFAMISASFSKEGLTPEVFAEIQELYSPDADFDMDDIRLPVAPAQSDAQDEQSAGEVNKDELGHLHELIEEYIRSNNLEESVSVRYSGDKLLLTLTNDIWFVSGSAEVSPEMQEKAVLLAELLSDTQNVDTPFDVIVTGHTDDIPISTARYPSNWDLSVDRAVKFLDILIKESGISPNYFSARGCAETEPIDTNETPEGRQMNRRVEVLISQLSERREALYPEASSGY